MRSLCHAIVFWLSAFIPYFPFFSVQPSLFYFFSFHKTKEAIVCIVINTEVTQRNESPYIFVDTEIKVLPAFNF